LFRDWSIIRRGRVMIFQHYLSIYVKYYGAKNFYATGREGSLKNMQIKLKMHQPSPSNY
jgi:hypothetical protein